MELLEDLFIAYYDARRNKRNTLNQLQFELRLEDNLLDLYHRLKNRTYRPGRSVAFVIEKPVKREVFAADFSDRVVHHLYFTYVNEIFERNFIDDSYSCRQEKGTLYGVRRLEHHIRSCSQNYTRECYVLKLDISGYFMSIDRARLYAVIEETLHRYARRKNRSGEYFSDALDYDLLLFLSRAIALHDPVSDCIVKGRPSDWAGLPSDKSLFLTPPGCGLPIGNLTSQLFSNVYLDVFDQYVKRELHIKHYGRYVDDFYLVDNSKDRLKHCIVAIRDFLRCRLGLVLHPRKIYLQPVCRGALFLGIIVKPYRRYAGRRTTTNFKQSLARGAAFYGSDAVALQQTLNSYLGYLGHHRTYRLRKTFLLQQLWIFKYGWVSKSYRRFRGDASVLPNLPPC
jgi:retron-type reverse transcriptase